MRAQACSQLAHTYVKDTRVDKNAGTLELTEPLQSFRLRSLLIAIKHTRTIDHNLKGYHNDLIRSPRHSPRQMVTHFSFVSFPMAGWLNLRPLLELKSSFLHTPHQSRITIEKSR